MGLIRKFIKSSIIAFSLCTVANASWQEASEMVSSGWGNGETQFGMEYSDSFDFFPTVLDVSSDGHILVGDGINGRFKLYEPGGQFIRNIIPPLENPKDWVIIPTFVNTNIFLPAKKYFFFSLDGALVSSIEGPGQIDSWQGINGKLYIKQRAPTRQWLSYSPTGELLQTYTERPLELGHFKSSRIGADQYKSTITYPDTVYSITANHEVGNFIRDQNKYLYGIESFVEKRGDAEPHIERVHKYDRCGKEIAMLELPLSTYEPEPEWAKDAPTGTSIPIAEYGEPVIGPNGNVYTWVRSKTDYKIVKWTWVDEPTDPKGGPDAPVNLNALPSMSGIYLSWGISPSDPGCVTGYEVERATSSNGIFTTVSTVAAGVLNFNDTTAAQGSTYFYKIRAVTGGMASDYTGEVSGTRP